MDKLVSIFGGTGFIGGLITEKLVANGYSVNIYTRIPENFSDSENIHYKNYSDFSSIEDNDCVINLAGASVAGKRWTEKYKKLIYNSRIETTRKITNAILNSSNPPKCFLSASGTGFYGDKGNELTYESSSPGNDFLAKVCVDWENEAIKASEVTRVVTIRTAVVLDKHEGALPKLMLPFKLFVGSWLGSGKQYFPWIHKEDLVSTYIHAMKNENISGALNASAPETLTNKQFSKILAASLNRPCLFPLPGFKLKLLVGEFAETLLTGQRIVPEVLNSTKFNFKYPELQSALSNLLDS